jgi:L-ascorbate metabolism protein UlaG (beta-lactamase superfamily)
MKNHSEILLVSSPEVLTAIRDQDPESEQVEARLQEVWPEEGATLSLTLRGVPVEFVQLSHEGSEFYPARCLGHVIHLGGKVILHIGDAELRPELFERLGLGSREIDVALIPYWLLKLESTPEFLRKHIGAKTVVATHVPPPLSQDETVSAISRLFPDVVLLRQPMESLELR